MPSDSFIFQFDMTHNIINLSASGTIAVVSIVLLVASLRFFKK